MWESNHLYATAIICDLQKLESSFLGDDFKRRGPRIYGVLDELFQGVDRRDDDLSGSNLVDYSRFQGLFRVVRGVLDFVCNGVDLP